LRRTPPLRIFYDAMFEVAVVAACLALTLAIGLGLRRHARTRVNLGSVSQQWLVGHRTEDS